MATATATRSAARRPMGYGGVELDRGQLFLATGLRNDEKLFRLGYCEELPRKAETYACVDCGAEFVDLASRTAHGNKRHPAFPRERTPLEEDQAAESEARLLDTLAPLYLDKTLASQKG